MFALAADLGGSIGVLVVGVVGGLVVLAYLAFVFFIQFYGQAIVLDDLGALDGLTHSVAVVRNNLLATLGYTVLAVFVGGLTVPVYALASALVSPGTTAVVAIHDVSPAILLRAILLVLIVTTLVGGYFAVYSVSFFRLIDPGPAET